MRAVPVPQKVGIFVHLPGACSLEETTGTFGHAHTCFCPSPYGPDGLSFPLSAPHIYIPMQDCMAVTSRMSPAAVVRRLRDTGWGI